MSNQSSEQEAHEKAVAIFRKYDSQNRNWLDHHTMMAALTELGVIEGLTQKKLAEIVSFGGSDNVKDRKYKVSEFMGFYDKLSQYQRKAARANHVKETSRMPGVPEGAERNEVLKRVFVNYCRYTVGQGRLSFDPADPKMSSTQFVKLCQDLCLVQPNGPLNVVTIDIIFHKCKPQGGRRLTFELYLKALYAATESSKIDAFARVGMLGEQLSHVDEEAGFQAVEPINFRQESRPVDRHADIEPVEPDPAFNQPRERGWNGEPGDNAPEWVGHLIERVNDVEGQVDTVAKDADDAKAAAGSAADKAKEKAKVDDLSKRVSELETDKEALERRVSAAEKREKAMQGEIDELNDNLAKQAAKHVSKELSEQLPIQIEKMMNEGEMQKKIKAAVDKAAADALEKLKALEDREDMILKRLDAIEAREKIFDKRLKDLEEREKAVSEREALGASERLEALERDQKKLQQMAENQNRAAQDAMRAAEVKQNMAERLGERLADEAAENDRKFKDMMAAIERREKQVADDAAERQEEADAREKKVAKNAAEAQRVAAQLQAQADHVQALLEALESREKQASQNAANMQRMLMEEETKKKQGLNTDISAARLEAVENACHGHDKQMVELGSKIVQAMSAMKKQGVDYEDRISKLEEAVIALQNEVDKLRYQNQNLTQKLDQVARQCSMSSQEKEASIAQLMTRQDLLEKKSGSSSATIISLEGLIQSKMAELETSNKVLEGRLQGMKDAIPRLEQQLQQSNQSAALKAQNSGIVGGGMAQDSRLAELERRLAASDRSQKDLQDMIKALQSGHESMALSSQPSRKAMRNAPSDSDDARALILVQTDLQGFKADYDSAMVFLKSDLDQLLSRITALESTRRDMSSYAPLVELRELENHLMARWTLQEDVVQNINKQLGNCIGDLERLNQSKGGSSEGTVANIQMQVQTHLDQVYNNLMSQLESRWATLEALQQSHDMSRSNDEAIMQSLKDTDKKFSDNLNIKEQVMIKLARQIDFIQNYLKDNFESFSSNGAQPQITVTQGGSAPMSNLIALQSQMKRPLGSMMSMGPGQGQPGMQPGGMQPYPPGQGQGNRGMMHMESMASEPDYNSQPYR